jgi:hypothetical protein
MHRPLLYHQSSHRASPAQSSLAVGSSYNLVLLRHQNLVGGELHAVAARFLHTFNLLEFWNKLNEWTMDGKWKPNRDLAEQIGGREAHLDREKVVSVPVRGAELQSAGAAVSVHQRQSPQQLGLGLLELVGALALGDHRCRGRPENTKSD